MSKTVRVTDDVAARIARERKGRETPNDTIRRILGLPATPAGAKRAAA